MSTVDASGRIGDRATIHALGWRAGDRLQLQLSRGLVTITPSDAGTIAVSGQARIHLPAHTRYAVGIRTGDQVLLAADPDHGRLVVHPLTALDAMIDHLATRTQAGATI